MSELYTIACENCGKDTAFARHEVPELESDIAAEVDAAEQAARDEVEEEFAGHIDPAELGHGEACGFDLFELSAAIRRSDRSEAELQLDRLARAMGPAATERVQIGRFSTRAKRAA